MVDTGFAPTAEQCERLIDRHGSRRSRPLRGHACTNGSGGLYSTGDDMAIWLRHNLEANETLALSHAVYWQRQSLTAAIGFDEPTARCPASVSAGSAWRPTAPSLRC